MRVRRTSLGGRRVERFVIECFAPSCHVDIAGHAELVTSAPRDTVDSIMSIEGSGLVQNRGETCRSERPEKNGETRTPRGLSVMSQDSAAPEAARKLSGRRRREVVAVLLFSGGPIFESSIPLSVFGIDRQDAGVPRYRLLVCAGEEGPLRTTGGLELTAPYGLEAIGRAGTVVVPAWRSITSPPPPEALDALRRAHEEEPASSDCAPVRSSWPRPVCSTAVRRPRTGCTRPRWRNGIRPSMWIRASSSSTTAMCSPPRARRPESISASTSCAPTTAPRRPEHWPAGWWCHHGAAAGRNAIWTGLYLRKSGRTRWPRSSRGRWSISMSSSTWRHWRPGRT